MKPVLVVLFQKRLHSSIGVQIVEYVLELRAVSRQEALYGDWRQGGPTQGVVLLYDLVHARRRDLVGDIDACPWNIRSISEISCRAIIV